MQPKKIPKILLIGAGRFGKKHLEKLLMLEKKGLCEILGVIVATEGSRSHIESTYGVKVWSETTVDLLKKTDAVFIVTPPETHFKIAFTCLPYTNVFIEKPMTTNSKDAKKLEILAKKYKKILMVGHIFRFDPTSIKLKSLIVPLKNEPVLIKGNFINPASKDVGRSIPFEMCHLFDLVDFVFDSSTPSIINTTHHERIDTINILYTNGIHAEFSLGWKDSISKRDIHFAFSSTDIHCDLLNSEIRIKDQVKGKTKIINCKTTDDLLTNEILYFFKVLKNNKVPYPDSKNGIRIVQTAEKASQLFQKKKAKPKIAVIGGGIFGANCAIELSSFADVTLYEKNNDIMQEASFINQYRHHWGYHYPRSDKTVHDIRLAIDDFEDKYNEAVIRDFPTYYCIAKKNSKTSAEEYIEFCKRNSLPIDIEYPDENYVDRSKISLSLKTLEPIYDYPKLKNLVLLALKKSPYIKIKFNTRVIGGKIEKNGQKSLSTKNSKGVKNTEVYDYIINTTYAQYNQFSKWFKFPIKPVRIDLVESLIVRLPIPKISLAIMDGPFTNLVPTRDEGKFTLVHIKESIVERYVPKNGLPTIKKSIPSHIQKTLTKSQEWLPILKHAEVLEVRHVFRAVNAYREHDDGRPSDVEYHTFGCWSVLGGKIINSITTAKKIASTIQNDYHNL